MLVARRDPPFHAGDAGPADFRVYSDAPPHRLTRFATVMQLLGSLVAVPVGLASAYSLYHATFSVEASCQSLRAGIVAMLDKSVDATTRRMLVRRDVVTFEQNCGAVDPDATTAFKALLAAEKTAAVPAGTPSPVEVRLPNNETQPKAPVRKAEPHPLAKQPQAAEAVRRNPTVSDTQWVDAVRQALLTRSAEPPPVDAAKAPVAAAPSLRPFQQEPVAPVPVVVAPAPTPVTTSAVPPSVIPATPQDGVDHPVPPGIIPDAVPPADAAAAKPDKSRHSRIGGWIAKIPLLGPVVENGRQ